VTERITNLINALLKPLEADWVNGKSDGHPIARVKRLRAALLPDLINGDLNEAERERLWQLLDDTELAQQLNHYPPDYVTEGCAKGRIIETVERFEEDLTGKVSVHGPVEAVVTVGDAIEVSTSRLARGESDPLMVAIEEQLQTMLGIPIPAATPVEAL
jgi:hypothetical protein